MPMTNKKHEQSTAYHEAGHAVAGLTHGIDVGLLDIRPQRTPDGRIGLGSVSFPKPPPESVLGKGELTVMPHLVFILAGWQAEKLIDPAATLEVNGDISDGMVALKYAAGALCTPYRTGSGHWAWSSAEQEHKRKQIMALIEVGTKRSEEFVALHNAAIRAVAEKLLADQVMLPREVRSLLDGFANRK